jgi:hypothetical protein
MRHTSPHISAQDISVHAIQCLELLAATARARSVLSTRLEGYHNPCWVGGTCALDKLAEALLCYSWRAEGDGGGCVFGGECTSRRLNRHATSSADSAIEGGSG